ncbi:MAG: 50S ribosomal protein L15 [Alphaproteobacteria bacterium]|nr:50S ribosomal protein L15 [Alphaproteobacteria bacterium]
MKLNQLADNQGARKGRMRVGRGIGSGKGKTGGRGVKGQKSRTGVAIKGFEGGQMPLYRRLPKRGFNHSALRADYVEVNVGRLQQAVDAKKLDPKKPVDAEALVAAGVVRRVRDGVRLLGKGDLTAKLDLQVAGASKGAVEAVEKAGGSVTLPAPVERKEGKRAARKKAAAEKRAAGAAAYASQE